jgi:hypothetical protein
MSGDELTDDQRTAATIPAGISNYVASAALAVLAGATALFTYVSQQFDAPSTFDWAMGIGAGVLVLAIFLGGRGSATLTRQIADGTWDAEKKICTYNWQAILTLVGLVLVLVATVIGTTAEPSTDKTDHRLDKLERKVDKLR